MRSLNRIEQPEKKRPKVIASRVSVRAVQSLIRRSIPGWSDDGASHRVNCDTPPLKGYCQGTLVPRCELYQALDLSKILVPS